MKANIAKLIDNAALKPFLTEEQVVKVAMDSEELGIYAICVNPYHVRLVSENTNRIKVCSVVGFPLGLNKTSVKLMECEEALGDGAEELDVVINISALKSGHYDYVLKELKELRKITEGYILKIIIETCYLTEEEKVKATELCVEAGADFVKTSTGFGDGGATLEDVKLLRKVTRGRIKIKASGGIKTLQEALTFIEAGAERIGTSRGIEIVKEFLNSKESLPFGKES
ncbi:deoxyribose-phosphate aldolase [Aquifex sp.]